jgi:trimethylamine:corrinoid methyltransferase-like protein
MIQTHENRIASARYTRMGRDACDRIHVATLEILERTGVDVHRRYRSYGFPWKTIDADGT